MVRLFLPLLCSALFLTTLGATSQQLAVNEGQSEAFASEIIEPAKAEALTETDQSLWNQTTDKPTLEALSVYLAKFPNGKYL